MKISIVIACYNEQDTLAFLATKLEALSKFMKDDYELEVIFVDDGSKDFTYKLLNSLFGHQPWFRLLRHEKNRGFGQALRTGLNAATGDLVVTIDADTNYDHLEIPIILSYLQDGVDIVSASPWSGEGNRQNFPLHRFIFSRTLSWLYRHFLKDEAPEIHTFTSGFRVYRRQVIEDVVFEADDFIATAEILIRAIRKGYQVKEYPTVVYERKFGRSKLKTLKTIFGHLGVLYRLSRGQDFLRVKQPQQELNLHQILQEQ
jgi:glycosyltransferase involved in cell wall biosynthesis